ncbi:MULTISPECIES: F0F1 ATP synthase subunit epsilon [unclassified Flavobacterium]|uniref:F0F1 ATP synthase subunit epsilon n=1 Tax=unclassified Flavobacterium TaxID=196869 RepID=UPI001F143311|nr:MULTISPECIES: F0F1 ATP synthase subunit epsilon [unclassified Flavobacterium]UMY66561.1 F0F1 ATP synthase subunit epsilon [Flavobacterium sp. HJ-32-4]
MTLEIVSPEATLFKGEVTSVTLPGVDGSFQILNHHAPIVSILKEGDIRIVSDSFATAKNVSDRFVTIDGKTHTLHIKSGTIEMNDNKVIVLAD